MAAKFLVVANWKANKTLFAAEEWCRAFSTHPLPGGVEIVLAAPYPLLRPLARETRDLKLPLVLGAQDISAFGPGPYTGEVTGEMLSELGVKYVLVGHSERRKLLGETTADVAKKTARARDAGIIPIICARNLSDIPNFSNLPKPSCVMYEPEEAISTNGSYRPELPENINRVLESWQAKLSAGTKFLYGGSLSPDFKFQTLNFQLISGLVVGHASLDPGSFFAIIEGCLPSAS